RRADRQPRQPDQRRSAGHLSAVEGRTRHHHRPDHARAAGGRVRLAHHPLQGRPRRVGPAEHVAPRRGRRARSGRARPRRGRVTVPSRTALAIALRALRRNRLQTSLTIIGMTIGVAAVLTMIAIGTGAETAIENQIRAAGMNLIVVTAGNYKVKSTDDFGGGAVEPSAALRRSDEPNLRPAIWD